MVQKSQGQPPFGCIPNPGSKRDKLPTSTGYIAGFLNHQHDVLVDMISVEGATLSLYIWGAMLFGDPKKTKGRNACFFSRLWE